MKQIEISDKGKYLKDHYPFADVPKLTDKVECIHCGKTYKVGQYNVFMDNGGTEYICCADPECDGTVIDWVKPG